MNHNEIADKVSSCVAAGNVMDRKADSGSTIDVRDNHGRLSFTCRRLLGGRIPLPDVTNGANLLKRDVMFFMVAFENELKAADGALGSVKYMSPMQAGGFSPGLYVEVTVLADIESEPADSVWDAAKKAAKRTGFKVK